MKTLKDKLVKEIEKIFLCLDEREKKILRLRFGLGGEEYQHTLEEVGKSFDLTRERIRQIEAKALQKLRGCEKLKKLRALLGEDLYLKEENGNRKRKEKENAKVLEANA